MAAHARGAAGPARVYIPVVSAGPAIQVISVMAESPANARRDVVLSFHDLASRLRNPPGTPDTAMAVIAASPTQRAGGASSSSAVASVPRNTAPISSGRVSPAGRCERSRARPRRGALTAAARA